MKIEEISETIEQALGDLATLPPETRMLYHASCNGNRDTTNYILILEKFDDDEYYKIKNEHLRLDDPDHLASTMFHSKKRLKSNDYTAILDSLYHGNHDIKFAEAVKYLFNLCHWIGRNYVISGNFKYNLTSKTNGTAYYTYKTNRKGKVDFQIVLFLDRLVDGGLVLDMKDHDFVAPIEKKASNEQEEEVPYAVSS
jgi:hypothetical protein